MKLTLAVIAGLSLISHELRAQTAAFTVGPRINTSMSAASPVGRPLVGAITGAAAGLLVGGIVGGYIGGNKCTDEGNPDSCYLIAGVFGGAAVGVTLGTPLGAHFMNRRQGSLPWSLLASTGIAAAGAVAIRHADLHARGNNRVLILNSLIVGVPVLQIISSTLIESRTGRR